MFQDKGPQGAKLFDPKRSEEYQGGGDVGGLSNKFKKAETEEAIKAWGEKIAQIKKGMEDGTISIVEGGDQINELMNIKPFEYSDQKTNEVFRETLSRNNAKEIAKIKKQIDNKEITPEEGAKLIDLIENPIKVEVQKIRDRINGKKDGFKKAA